MAETYSKDEMDRRMKGCVAAVKKAHKRIDYLIDEFSQYRGQILTIFI